MPWNFLPAYAAFERLTAGKMNLIRENLNILKAPVTDQKTIALGANITTTSTTPVGTYFPDYNVTLTPSILTGTCNLDVFARFNLRCSADGTARTVKFTYYLDGAPLGALLTVSGNNTVIFPIHLFHRFTGVTPGVRQVQLVWWTSGGAATIFSNTADANYCIGLMMARES